MAQNKATFTLQDFDAENSTMSINIGPLTAANFTAKRDAIDDLKVAMADIVAGEIRKTSVTEQFAESADPVTDPTAQRENKWLAILRDVTQFLDVGNTINNVGFGNLFTVEIPTALLSLLAGNVGSLNLATPVIAAFVTALEAVANSPTGGNEVEVVEIKHVGRNI
jgi:hypothetical protein